MPNAAPLAVPPILALVLVLSAGSTRAGGEAPAGPACGAGTVALFGHMRELPAGVLKAVGFEMADAGAPWQATDVMRRGGPLPFRRFISARQIGCTLKLNYERGGIAHGYDTVVMTQTGGRWALRPPPR